MTTKRLDPFAAKREAMRREFFDRMFLLGGMLTGTDTYKRTMWAAADEIAVKRAAYHLTLRKGLGAVEQGAGDQLVMAGHEAMLAQWFRRPLKRSDIRLSAAWADQQSNVRAFPHRMWNQILADQPRKQNINLPMDVWGFPGGQTFLKGVPCMSFEGMGGAISYVEPAMCRYFQPIIQATKARLMKLASPNDAEFGLRAAVNEMANLVLLLARYVGSGGTGRLTSNDTAEFLYPELFKSIGTIGHEMMCSNQSFDRTLAECEYEMMDLALTKVPDSKLLCDLLDAESVGYGNALRALLAHPEATRAGIRVDSGNIAAQCVQYHKGFKSAGITPARVIVFEDEVKPELVKRVYDEFRSQTGEEPVILFPGAGGWWWTNVHRDAVSAAFKRSATEGNPNIKFSNSPGKESIPGYIRVYGRGEVMYIADASEVVDGEPLFVKLVDNGRIVYNESFQTQAARSESSWGRFTKVELSPLISGYMERFRAMRSAEVAAAKAQLVS